MLNCDETGIHWKKMPNRTYITKEEKSMPARKPMKDRNTMIVCDNASGDCKIKPMVIYHSVNPRILKRNKVMMSKLPAMWQSNPKCWCTRQYFAEWMNEAFFLQVKEYLKEKQLPLKCLLTMDNATAQPRDLDDDLPDGFDVIKVKFLPPNATTFSDPSFPHLSLPFIHVRRTLQPKRYVYE